MPLWQREAARMGASVPSLRVRPMAGGLGEGAMAQPRRRRSLQDQHPAVGRRRQEATCGRLLWVEESSTVAMRRWVAACKRVVAAHSSMAVAGHTAGGGWARWQRRRVVRGRLMRSCVGRRRRAM